MTLYNLNFRSTEGAWGETGNNGRILPADAYPVAQAGLTCGWVGGTPLAANYATAVNAKLSGRNASNTNVVYFRVDLPDGPGTYRLWGSFCAMATSVTTAFVIRDGAGSAIQTVGATAVTGNTNPTLCQVLDASGAVILHDTYVSTGGTYIEFTATSDHIRIERNAAAAITMYVNNLQLEHQVAPLEAATLTTEWGTGTHAGTIWAKEPPAKGIGKVSSPLGVQVFSVVGAAATYFTIEDRGADKWLVTTSTRIPDGWSGNVTIRQTTPDETKDTDIALTATAITRATTGYLGRVTSGTLNQRATVKAVIDAELWAGYTGQAFASDQTSNSPSDLATKINALTPDGTSWYRIRLQDGTWTGSGFNFSQKNFGTGGLLLEPDTGHDPMVKCEFRNCLLHKCHIRNLRCGPWDAGTGKYNLQAGIPGSGPYPLFRFSGMRVGAYFDTGFSVATWTNWADFIYFEFAEQIAVHDSQFVGMQNCATITGGRIMSFVNNTHRLVARDFHALTTAFRFNTPRGVFADNLTYIEIRNGTAWHNPDIYTGLDFFNTPHGDWFQYRRTTGGVSGAYPTTSAGINGSTSVPWVVGFVGFNPAENRLYNVVAVTGDGLINPASPPTGTGTGIVSGNVTFDYREEYTLGTTCHLWMENNCIHQDGVSVNLDGNAFPNVQFVINSNSNWNNILNVIAINNICCSGNSRGIIAGDPDGDVHAELNTFAGGAAKPLPNDQAIISGRNVRAARNIVGIEGGVPRVAGATNQLSEHNVAANFKADATEPNRPGDVMQGTFTFDGTNGYGYSLTDDDTVTAAEFRSNLSKQLHHITGAAGAKLEEMHTITLDNGSTQANYTLTINP